MSVSLTEPGLHRRDICKGASTSVETAMQQQREAPRIVLIISRRSSSRRRPRIASLWLAKIAPHDKRAGLWRPSADW